MKTATLPTEPTQTIACLGGGQLGRMMALESPRLNLSMRFLDPTGPSCPAGQVVGASNIVTGALDDEAKLEELAQGCNLVTCEIEHVGVEGLRRLEERGVNVQPGSRVIEIIQDKFVQKEHFAKHSIPLPPYTNLPSIESIHAAALQHGLPLMLKSRKGAYDGRGNTVLRETTDEAINSALSDLGIKPTESGDITNLYAEGWINFHSEVAVMVVRSPTGEIRAYPATTAIQTDSICRVVLVPARNVPASVRHKCEQVAMKAVAALGEGATGVFGVELFLANENNGEMEVLLNEVAPRPHNTGHYTQDACGVSQFENHLRAVCGLPLGDTGLTVGAAAMVNILGAKVGDINDTMKGINAALSMPRTVVHWYGKDQRPGRKMGHINITADSHGEIDATLHKILQLENISPDALPKNCQHVPLVAVIMGSQSDLPTMQDGVNILKQFKIPYEVDIVSAHRTPEKLMHYAKSAASRGIQVIIAGAGGAAHLPGMVAAMTPLPVIGVPIKTSTLNGQDSLLSIVQMPRGIPVATVAIGNATNAGLLAVRMLCASRPELRDKMEEYQANMKEAVEKTSHLLLEVGSDVYLEGMGSKNKEVNV